MSSPKDIKRKCSLCRIPGHNKAECPHQSSETSKVSSKSGSHPVFLRVIKNAPPSAHVVNLRNEQDSHTTFPVYREQKNGQKVERVQVDLSAMVRAANKNSQKKLQTPAPSFLKPTITVTKIHSAPRVKPPSFLPDIPETAQDFFQNSVSEESVEKQKNNTTNQYSPKFTIFASFDFNTLIVRAVAVLLLLVLPFPAFAYYQEVKHTTNKVVDQTTTAFLSLQASTVAALQANIPQAELDLNNALSAFSNAEAVLDKEHKVIQYVAGLLPVLGSEVQSRQYILQAGHHLALGNTYLVQGIKVSREGNKNLIQKINDVSVHLRSAIPQYEEAQLLLSRVKVSAVPVEYQQSFQEFKLLFSTFIDDMRDLNTLSQSIQTIFGGSDFRRYLVVFQNNHELRPTGGFVGSMAIIDVQKGKILNIDVPAGGSYDLKGQLSSYVKPPAPLLLTNGRFEFQDANWWPDFAASAQKMSEFYQLSRGTTVDGVISINASVLEKVLGVLGPLENEKHKVELDETNVLGVLQQKVENDFDKQQNTPKAIIGDILGDLVTQTKELDAAKALQLLSVMHGSLEEKSIQVYMKDAEVEKDLREFGWTGEILPVPVSQDYLMVVQSNILSQKSDAKIEQTIEHQATVAEDGTVTDTVIIRRKHNGKTGEEFYGVPNISYVRAYVPEGAELLDAGGFNYPPEDAFHVSKKWYTDDKDVQNLEKELGTHSKTGTRIFSGFQKTIFGNWMITLPGETTESYFVYKLPFSVVQKEELQPQKDWKETLLGVHKKQTSSYHLVVQAQSGIKTDFTTSIIYSPGWKPSWVSSADTMTRATNGAELKTILRKQENIGVVMEKIESPEK